MQRQTWRAVWAVVLSGFLTVGVPLARADLFETARSQTPVTLGQFDTAGVGIRGGLNLQTYLRPQTVTLLRGNTNVGGSCGAFDFAASLQQTFEELPDYFSALGEGIVASLPQLILCYASPTLCDLYKHFQAIANAVLQARYAQCQEVQTAAAAAGLYLRGGESARCLEAEQQRGTSISVALSRCLGEVSSIRSPRGGQATRVELVKETLEAAGADATTVALARQMLGEVTLTAGGSALGTAQERPTNSLHRRYEAFQAESTARVQEAVDLVAAGQPLPDTLLQELSIPGQVLPRAAIDALVSLQGDPMRYELFRQKLGSGLGITRLTWEVQELHGQLASAYLVNAELTEEERRLLALRLAGLQQELARLLTEKETAERHLLPVLEALLAEQVAVQAEAAQVGLRAPSGRPPPTPWASGQINAGFGY